MSSPLLENRLAFALFGAAMASAVLWPVAQNWRKVPQDDFPLSYYPMFTARRSELTRVNYLVGLDGTGGRHPLPYTLAGVGGMNQVRRQINRAIREGRELELAHTVAFNAAGRGDLREIRTVLVVKGAFRLRDYFSGDTEPHSEKVLASATVERSDG